MIFIEETDTRFYIEESTLPNAGWGCFAKEFLKKGDWLEVIGIYVTKGGIADQCTHYAKRYKFAGSPKMNAKILPMGYAALVNHTDDSNLQNCALEYKPGLNKRSQHAGQVIYRFIKDILPNQELLGNYGPDISEEVRKISDTLEFADANDKEIQRFLKFNLYNLNEIC